MEKDSKANMMGLDGNIVDRKAAIIMETQTAIDMVEQKVE